MKVIEILKFNGEFLKRLQMAGIWVGKNKILSNPFDKCSKVELNAYVNYNSTYTDMMLYRNGD